MRLALLLATLAVPAAAQFTLQTSNTIADLRGIHNVGNGVAWASGTQGTVLRTEDGGYVWQTCSIPPGADKLDFRGVQAFDANTAIIMSSGPGDQSRLYKTTDGCHTWKLLFTNPDRDGFWDAIQFSNQKDGLLLGDPVGGSFVLESSSDGGVTWHRHTLPSSLKDEGAFAASNSSVLRADRKDGTIWIVTGGQAGARILTRCTACSSGEFDKKGWFVQAMASFGHGASIGIFSIAADNPGTPSKLITVGGDYSHPDSVGMASYSLDRLSWTASTAPPHGYRSSVAYDADTKTWIAVGPNGTDISTDDGRNWRPAHPDPAIHETADADRNWNALSLPYVVGPKGRIGRLDPAALKR